MNRIPLSFLPGILRNLGVAWRLMNHPSVSPAVKFLLPLAAVVYKVSPIDLMPGLPFDDIFLILFVFPRLMIRLSPPDAVADAMYGTQSRPAPDDDETIDVPWQTIS